MKKILSLIVLSLFLFSGTMAQNVGLDRIGTDFERNQPSPGPLQSMVDVLTSPFKVIKSNGDIFGFTTYALATAYYTEATDVITWYNTVIIDTGFATYWAAGGSTVLATSGTDAACTDGDRYWVEVHITHPTILQGLTVLNGSVGGTDSIVVELFNAAGTLLASSDTDDHNLLVGTAAEFTAYPFDAAIFVKPGIYYASVQYNGTTAKFRAYPIPGSKFIAATASGTYSTPAAITPGETFTAGKGPILHTY